MTDDIEVGDVRRLTELLFEKYGFDFKNYAMSSLRRRIKRVIEIYKIKSVSALITMLDEDEGFVQEFVSEITVNVTEMFRDPTLWSYLKEEVIPGILKEHQKISIWHAGCSSGEEVMSMAILLKELGGLDVAHIVATDLDEAILDRAKKGQVSAKNMELNQKNYQTYGASESINKYFTAKGSQFEIDSELLKNVSFRKHDLVTGQVFSRFDLVMCRNVMIYFNQNLQNEVLSKLHKSLFKYGHLCIGSKESLIWCDIAQKFTTVNNEEKVYKKIKD